MLVCVMRKQGRLRELRRQIIDEVWVRDWREVWFYPARDGVMGWEGTQDIMFVGINPSTGHSFSKNDDFYYAELAKNGFANAHLTDVVKERATATEREVLLDDPATMRRHQGYFMDEIDIVRPRMIIPVGQRAARVLSLWLPGDDRLWLPHPTDKRRRVPHYSAQITTAATRREFGMSMVKVRTSYGSRG